MVLLMVAACGRPSSGGDESSATDGASTGASESTADASMSASTSASTSTSSTSVDPDATSVDPDDGSTSSSTGGEPLPSAEVHLVGRFDADDRATWSGSTMRTRIDGTSLDLELDGAGGVRFQVVVDGEPTSVFVTTGGPQTYPIATGLAPGEHDVQVVRRNEGYFGAVQYVAFVPGADTTLVETPWPYAHRIEYIGDSLTAGYGIECDSATQNFSAETESAWPTYAMEAARQLDAAPHLIAFSGKGAYQNYGGNLDEPMPVLYPRTLTDDPSSAWDFAAFVPDVVVINLGTNDFSAAIGMDAFVGAYASLVQTVRGHYPEALVVAVTWAHWGAEHEGWVQAALDQAGESNAITTRFEILSDEGYGCDYHTNEVTNARLGTELAETLRGELGW